MRCRFVAAGLRVRLGIWLLLGTSVLLLSAGCGRTGGAVSPAEALPDSEAVPGWARSGGVATFTPANLFDLMDGQSESFFVYGFEEAAVGRYAGPDDASLQVEIYRLAGPADAYGLFTVSIAGAPVAVGVDGDTDPGRRLIFWQDRFYVHIIAPRPIADADLLAFGRAVAGALPRGGERPSLINSLPAAGLVPRSARFFHQELSFQNWLWLGGTNLLGLSPETDGVLADYEQNDRKGRLLLVVYRQAGQATEALAALQAGGVSGLVTADVDGTTLGAVFGDLDKEAAGKLLKEAFAERYRK
jgi:hypothetical protein